MKNKSHCQLLNWLKMGFITYKNYSKKSLMKNIFMDTVGLQFDPPFTKAISYFLINLYY